VTDRDILARIVHAREALEDGDEQLARTLLEGLLNEPSVPARRCGLCGLRFRFPGDLDAHIRVSHPSHWLVDDL
jgi:hypothetical protein